MVGLSSRQYLPASSSRKIYLLQTQSVTKMAMGIKSLIDEAPCIPAAIGRKFCLQLLAGAHGYNLPSRMAMASAVKGRIDGVDGGVRPTNRLVLSFGKP